MPDSKAWWGTTEVPLGEQRYWSIGPLRLAIGHLPGEWRIRHLSGDDPLEGTVRLAEATRPDDFDVDRETVVRFANSDAHPGVSLWPALADRPVVSHPVEPFYVLPGEEARLFVSTPVRLAIRFGTQSYPFELPIVRPSDTWVGSTTGEGQAAYSSRTFCRSRLEDLPFRPHRCVTVVHVHNRAGSPLKLEKISVAVPHLSIYACDDGRLWTQSITLTREEDDDKVGIEISQAPPTEAAGNERLGGPREPVNGHALQRALGALF